VTSVIDSATLGMTTSSIMDIITFGQI